MGDGSYTKLRHLVSHRGFSFPAPNLVRLHPLPPSWKVTSVSNPQAHSESETFSLLYPSTLLSFQTSGLSLGSAADGGPEVRKHG